MKLIVVVMTMIISCYADTLANDFDFDYKNQMKGIENKRFNQNGKIAPTGFLGSGLLASPFLFIGVQIQYSFQNLMILKIYIILKFFFILFFNYLLFIYIDSIAL